MGNNKINTVLQVIKEYEYEAIPQANNLDKVVTAIEVMRHSYINEKDLATGFSMSSRQADYYSHALRFLELINTFQYGSNIMIGLNEDALTYFKTGNVKIKLKKWIIDNDYIFRYEKLLDKESDSENSTYKRRKQSLNAWKRWINNDK